MQKRSKSIFLTVIGLAGFLSFTFFVGPSPELIEACKIVVSGDDPSAIVNERLLDQCEKDKGFALMMTSESVNSQVIATSNQSEVLFSILQWLFLGLGIVGVLTLFQKNKK